MFNPADQRSPLLFLKSKIANQPGYVLIGHPARWQKVGPDYAGTDHHHAIYKKGEIKSLEKLQKNPEFAKLPKEDQIKAVQDDAKATQDKNTASSKASTFIQKVSAGKVPQASEWKHWLEQSRDKKSADIAKFTADPQTKAFWEMAIANYRAKAMANIERHKAEETQPEPTETVSGDKISKEKIAEKVALTSGDKFDHGELNVPGKSNKIDAELDKEKAKQAKQDKADAKTAIADKKAKKAKAKELFAQYGQEMIDQYGEKLGKKEVASTLDQMVKWEPTKFIAMVEKYQKEKAEKTDKKTDRPEPVKAEETQQDKAPETDKKADIEAEKKPDEPTDGTDYDAKIQEYATGATYKQKAYKTLSKDPDWQTLNSKDKLEALHDWYLMEQEKASLSGAMAKFKAALLSGKSPTKALVEKFNSLNKDDQAKVLKPVFEKMDKAEIGKLLEQSGAKPQDTGSASPIKHTFASKKDKTEANVADNGKGGWAVSLKDTESGSTFPTVEIFNSEDEAIAHAKELVGLKDKGPKEGDTKQGAEGMLVFKNGRWHKQDDGKAEAAPKVEKYYLNVPFSQKDHAKKNGAKWDKDKKLWYATPSSDGKLFINLEMYHPKHNNFVSEKGKSQIAAYAANMAAETGKDIQVHVTKDPQTGLTAYYAAEPDGTPVGDVSMGNWPKLGPAESVDAKPESQKADTESEKPKFTFKIKPHDEGGFMIESDNGGGYVSQKPKGMGLYGPGPKVFKTEDEAKAYLKKKGMTLDAGEVAKAPEQLSKKALEAMAYELGKKSDVGFSPLADPEMLHLMSQHDFSEVGSAEFLLQAWVKGKTEAHLAAPVPGWTEEENTRFKGQAESSGAEKPTDEVGHGSAWVASLASGKKPDADLDNKIVMMPEDRQQELFSKAALLWSKKQGLESDENAIGLSKQVLSDIMNNVELHEGDTKTINGVTYVLEGGRWHRANKPSTVGPAQKLEAMQMLGSSDLMDEIDAGKISAKTDKLLDVMGPDAKAAFYNWVSAYKNYGFSIYRKAAVCAAYGHPNEVLLKDGSWEKFDPGMINSHLAVPSDIHQKAVGEATIAAQNEPSSGPENPDTPQSFGHGTVNFIGPAKLHDLLSQKGWVTGDGPDFKQKFLKSMHDWSISQSKDDHGDWKQTVFYLHDMFPVGAMVKMDDSGKADWRVVQGDNALAFKNILTGEVQQYKKGEEVSHLMESLWNFNPTIIPPGHPDGKVLRNPVTDKLETDSPVIELPNSSTLEYKKADGIWHSRLKGVGGASWYPIGNGNVALVLAPQLDAVLAKVMDEKPTTDQVADDLPVFSMELPGGTQANYKKIDGIWQTENQLGKPDMGWHPINQDGWMVPELEQKLKAAQGDSYDLNQHPQVQSYIQAVADGTTPSLDDTAFVGKNTDGESYKQVFEVASEAYAKNHGLDPSDVNDKQLADMVALDLLLKNEHPKEGDTKVINGHTYQLINGRWHRMDKEQDQGFVTGLPHYENTKFKKEGDGWVFMASNGEWSPVGISVAEKLDEYQKNNPSPVTDVLKSPFDAIKTPHQAIDDSVLSATQKEKLKDQLDALKASAQQDGIAAFKGVLKYMSKSGKTIVKIPNGYKITIHDNKDWNKPWANDLLQYVNDLKAATELASGKKPKKTAPKKTSNAPDPIQPAAISSKTVMVGNAKARLIDDWEQTGPQGGSNPGGQFTDKSGKQWYCKFPGDPEVSKNEFLATKFYQMLGVSVPDMMLVQKDGKLGVATKWVDGLTKGSAKDLAKAQGAHEAFAIDAWLANWDVIGLANDNLLLDKDGKALRADAGGALIFRAQGGAKGDAFGDEVSELDTLTDPTKNAQAAAVFGDISSEKMAWGLGQLNKIKPSQIEELVDAIGPGTAEEKKALAKKLIARRANILQKFNIRDQWSKKPPDTTKLPVDPKDLPDAIDFNNFEGKGKPLSSVPDINDANTAASQALINFAAQGNLEALKTYQFDEYDKNTKSYTGKKIPIENHPSKHIQEQWAGLVQTLQSIAYPPADTLDMPPLGSGETPEEIAKEVGSFAPDKNISNISPEHVLGYFMKLGQVSQDVVESLKNAVDWKWTSPGKSPGYFQMLKGVYSKARQSVKEYISGVQSSGYVNHIWSQGKKEWQGHTINQLTADIYADAVEVDEGTQMWRWMDDDTAGKMMTKQFLSSHPGDILQNTDSMCTSFHEHWNESTHFVKDSSKAMLMRIRCVKGVKMSPTYATGSLAGEGEFTTLPGQRFIVIGIQKGGKLHPDGVFLDVIALPPDDGFVAQLGAASKS